MIIRNLSTITGVIQSVSDPIYIERKNKNPFVKVIMGVKTVDQQVIFFEVREANIQFDALVVGDTIDVEYYFAGSIKDSKMYNNIIAKDFFIHD